MDLPERDERRGRPEENTPAGVDGSEIEVTLCPGGEIVFSWNGPEIRDLAGSLGPAPFGLRAWCG